MIFRPDPYLIRPVYVRPDPIATPTPIPLLSPKCPNIHRTSLRELKIPDTGFLVHPMALKTLGAFSFSSTPTPCCKPSSPLPFPSSLRFHPRPPKTLIPPSSSAAPSSNSSPRSPIFLPHLESPALESIEDEVVADAAEEEEQIEKEFGEVHGSELEYDEVEDGREEEYSDPILNFFQSRSETRDPKREGRLTLQRNRRSSWHIADLESDDLEEEEEEEEEEEVQAVELDSDSGVPELASEDGVVGKIMGIARSLPENSTLGEFLDSFAGKVGEGECIELLGRMGEERLVRESLYLYEWMGLQEPSLVTPRSCSVLFPILGRAGMGDKLMVLFENLPRGKRFRDVCVYNAAISGLSCCGRCGSCSASWISFMCLSFTLFTYEKGMIMQIPT